MSGLNEIQKQIQNRHRKYWKRDTLDLTGWHCGRFSSVGLQLAERHIEIVREYLPDLTDEFVRNVVFTTFMEWQKAYGEPIEKILQMKDPLEQSRQFNELYSNFENKMSMFLVDTTQLAALAHLKEEFLGFFPNNLQNL